MKRSNGTTACLTLFCATLALVAGCSPQFYKESADREVYSILENKTPAVVGMTPTFTIEACQWDPLQDCPPVGPEELEALRQMTPADQQASQAAAAPPVVLSLAKALEIATLNSREYQTQKESLYLSVLGLTATRYAFDPHFFGLLGGDYNATDTGDVETASGSASFGFSWLFRTGTRVAMNVATDVGRLLTGDPRRTASSVINLTITQPLLQGAGIAVTEPLTQAERSVIYQMRSFVRFRRRFFANVLSDYYNVLAQRQILANQILNYENLRESRERDEAFARSGRKPEYEVDQVRQDELRAEDAVERARQTYQDRLDSFKITLGLPTESSIVLDSGELVNLWEHGVGEIDLTEDEAVDIALRNRLDLMTARQSAEDARRKLEVARNDLLPGLDLSASASMQTVGGNDWDDFDTYSLDFGGGFELDLPLDKLSERNAYRSSFISLDRAVRGYEEQRDQVVQEVRDSLRQYHRAAKTFDIEKISVELARRRVESTELLEEAGDVETRDVLESREALVRSKDALTTSLVDYKVASLDLARDMGILYVGEKGELEESFDVYK